MSIKRTIKCSICGTEYTEEVTGAGFPSWGSLLGINLNGEDNPDLCPEHLTAVANLIDSLVKVERVS